MVDYKLSEDYLNGNVVCLPSTIAEWVLIYTLDVENGLRSQYELEANIRDSNFNSWLRDESYRCVSGNCAYCYGIDQIKEEGLKIVPYNQVVLDNEEIW